MQQVPFIECVAERDIDLLLLEELSVSLAFRSWLVGQAFGPDQEFSQFVGAWHSVSHPSLGESDLIVLWRDGQARHTALLIENKIDAPPQPEQAARYHQRGHDGIEQGLWASFRTCMIAPQSYLAGTTDAAGYDVHLSYESIRDWFQSNDAQEARHIFRGRMVQEAIEQNRRGYQPTPHPAVTQFWVDYWGFVSKEFPQFQMKQPGPLPAGSDWPVLRATELGSNRRIVHKLASGVVDLELSTYHGTPEQLALRNRSALAGGMEVVKTGQSSSIRIVVPKVDRFGDLSSQTDAVREGLVAASRLKSISPEVDAG